MAKFGTPEHQSHMLTGVRKALASPRTPSHLKPHLQNRLSGGTPMFKKKGSGLVSQPITQPGVSKDPINAADQPEGPYAPQNYTFPSVKSNPQNPGSSAAGAGAGITTLPTKRPGAAKPSKKAARRKSAFYGEM